MVGAINREVEAGGRGRVGGDWQGAGWGCRAVYK